MAVDSRVGMTFGNYKITRLLGKGGGGVVYEAYDTGKGRTVALKILADEFSANTTFRTRFQRESRVAAMLRQIADTFIGWMAGIQLFIPAVLSG